MTYNINTLEREDLSQEKRKKWDFVQITIFITKKGKNVDMLFDVCYNMAGKKVYRF